MSERWIRYESQVDEAGFTQMPNVVATDSRLDPLTRYVYLHLRRFAFDKSTCFPGQERLSAEAGMTERALRNHINKLVDAGLVDVERRGQGKTNLYVLRNLDRNETTVLELRPGSCKEEEVEEDEVLKEKKQKKDPRIEEIFLYWQEKFGKERSRLTSGRRGKIEARLKQGFEVDQIKRAIDACYQSDFHRLGGYTDLTLICRSEEKLEFFLGLYQQDVPGRVEDDGFFDGTPFA